MPIPHTRARPARPASSARAPRAPRPSPAALLLAQALALALPFAPVGPAMAQTGSKLLGAPTPAPSYRSVAWEALMPAGWDGMKEFKRMDLAALQDDDPRAKALLKRLRESWDRAPVNMALVGQPVRLAGYVVPLEETEQGLAEFLLVPYHGACIHTPPPPANQIVHVQPRTPVKGLRSMDTVWVQGVLAYQRNDSAMGTASWSLPAVAVQRYDEGGLKATPLH